MIESQNLYRLQSKLTKNNKTIPIKTIEKDYVLSWVLIGIVKSKMFDLTVLKGGTLLKKVYFHGYRFSEDLDFTLLKDISVDNVERMLEDVYELVFDSANIRLAFKSKEIHRNGYTFFINFSGPLGADIKRGEIKLDFTIRERLIYRPLLKKLLGEYDEYTDLTESVILRVYSLKEIFIEKYLSVLDKSRNEPRDVYDLWYLIVNDSVGFNYLGRDINKKGSYKNIRSFNIIDVLSKKEKNYRKLWEIRLEPHMIELPHFDKVYRELKRNLRNMNIY